MPPPRNERQVPERERKELPDELTTYKRELESAPLPPRERREWLEWQIRRVQKRMAEVEARLTRI
jgi:hypothetical protein